jgi:uncharacterized protein (DUF697 family)
MKMNPINLLKMIGSIPFNVIDLKFDGKMDSKKQKAVADSIIRNHIVWSMGTGLIPFPVIDFIAVSAVQLDMVRQLSKIYEVDFKETEGKAVITSLTGSGLAQLGKHAAIKLIPGVGSVVGGIAMSVLSGASTYALGEVFREHFETGGTFLDFDPGRLKKYYQEKFEKGKKVAQEIRDEEERRKKEGAGGSIKKNSTSADEFVGETVKKEETTAKNTSTEEKATTETLSRQDKLLIKIKELAELKDMGILSAEEFQQMKTKLIEGF